MTTRPLNRKRGRPVSRFAKGNVRLLAFSLCVCVVSMQTTLEILKQLQQRSSGSRSLNWSQRPPQKSPVWTVNLEGWELEPQSAVASYAASVFWLQSRTVSTETNGMRQSLPCAPEVLWWEHNLDWQGDLGLWSSQGRPWPGRFIQGHRTPLLTTNWLKKTSGFGKQHCTCKKRGLSQRNAQWSAQICFYLKRDNVLNIYIS